MAYDLSDHPSSYYLDQFKEESIEIRPHVKAGRYLYNNGEWIKTSDDDKEGQWRQESPEEAIHEFVTESYYFYLCLESNNSVIDKSLIDLSRQVLGQIVELDQVARISIGNSSEGEFHLHWLYAKKEELEFNYAGVEVNMAFSVFFTRESDGTWKYTGF